MKKFSVVPLEAEERRAMFITALAIWIVLGFVAWYVPELEDKAKAAFYVMAAGILGVYFAECTWLWRRVLIYLRYLFPDPT